MPRAQVRRRDRRGVALAAAAEKGIRRWISARARLHNLCRPTTWPALAQAIGSTLLCGLIGLLIALAGAW